MTEPIKPHEVKVNMPDEVIEIFNDLIQENWDGKQAKVYQKTVLELIARKMGISAKEVLDQRYLDIESIFRAAGWRVVYDSPGYNESPYPAFFVFSDDPTHIIFGKSLHNWWEP